MIHEETATGFPNWGATAKGVCERTVRNCWTNKCVARLLQRTRYVETSERDGSELLAELGEPARHGDVGCAPALCIKNLAPVVLGVGGRVDCYMWRSAHPVSTSVKAESPNSRWSDTAKSVAEGLLTRCRPSVSFMYVTAFSL